MRKFKDKSTYWKEINNGFFVHNKDWNRTIERLPSLMSAQFVKTKLHTVDQMLASGFHGTGSIGYKQIEVRPDLDILRSNLVEGEYSIENLFLQWLYQFYVVEATSIINYPVPLLKWNNVFISMVEEGLHVMTYLAALISLYEDFNDDSEIRGNITQDTFLCTEFPVKDKVQELTETLYSKSIEYGESFRRHGVQGIIPRLWDKISRYAQLSASSCNIKYESKQDSAKDLLGYCIIAWSLIHELDELKPY